MTVCKYLHIDTDGTVLRTDFAWPNPADRRGDGLAEADAFIEASRGPVTIVTLPYGELGPGLPDGVESGDVHQYLATFPSGHKVRFGLAVVPVN